MEVPVGHGVVQVDPADVPLTRAHRWMIYKRPNARTLYVSTKIDGRTAYLHREIMKPGPDQEVDHINHDGLDCRRENMRLCTRKGNAANTCKRRATCTSKFKGVYWHARAGKWQAYLNRTAAPAKYLGLHKDEADAARAYDRAAREEYGEFAQLNFPG